MNSSNFKVEKPVLGYIVITASLLAGMVAATAFGQGETLSESQGKNQSGTQRKTQRKTQSEAEPSPLSKRLVPHRRWVLGVRADATDTGYLIQRVESSSAASRIGLESGDRIVAVNGQQIGFVGNKHVQLSRTLQQMGGENGHVQLLIQNRRNDRLVSISTMLRAPLQHLGH